MPLVNKRSPGRYNQGFFYYKLTHYLNSKGFMAVKLINYRIRINNKMMMIIAPTER